MLLLRCHSFNENVDFSVCVSMQLTDDVFYIVSLPLENMRLFLLHLWCDTFFRLGFYFNDISVNCAVQIDINKNCEEIKINLLSQQRKWQHKCYTLVGVIIQKTEQNTPVDSSIHSPRTRSLGRAGGTLCGKGHSMRTLLPSCTDNDRRRPSSYSEISAWTDKGKWKRNIVFFVDRTICEE